MRLINADALGIGKAEREVFTVPEYADGWNAAIDIIDAAPTVDIVLPTRSQFKRMAVQLGYEPVVRCQNCARWQRYTQVNRDFGHCEKHDCVMRFDDFCSRPERRTDEKI